MYIKRKQFLGPEQRPALILLQEDSTYPTLVSNGQWAIIGGKATSLIPTLITLWLKEIAAQFLEGSVKLGDMTRPRFEQLIHSRSKEKFECIHNWGSNLYEACFAPDRKQRKLVQDKLLSLDQTGLLMRRALTSTGGAQLDQDGNPIAFAWEFLHPTPHTLWLYAEYVSLLIKNGGRLLEYTPDNHVALIKDSDGKLLGAIAPYHPQGQDV
jgi:hypothetical protein